MAERLHLDRAHGDAKRFREGGDLERLAEMGADVRDGTREDRVVDGEGVRGAARDDAGVGDVNERFGGASVQDAIGYWLRSIPFNIVCKFKCNLYFSVDLLKL